MNFLLGSAIEALSEASALAEGYDIDSATLVEIATGTAFAAPVYVTYGKLIVDREFKPGFKLRLGLKDIRLALTAGEARGVPLPFASVVRDNLVDAIGHGAAESDWSALASVSRRRAGLA
jgi:3-hydroxyisobutyrate dehydrogenase-like beta-hydroxyacid dehydrogenase